MATVAPSAGMPEPDSAGATLPVPAFAPPYGANPVTRAARGSAGPPVLPPKPATWPYGVATALAWPLHVSSKRHVRPASCDCQRYAFQMKQHDGQNWSAAVIVLPVIAACASS